MKRFADAYIRPRARSHGYDSVELSLGAAIYRVVVAIESAGSSLTELGWSAGKGTPPVARRPDLART